LVLDSLPARLPRISAIARDGQQHAARARGDARHRRRDRELGDGEPVAEPDRALAEHAHEEEGDATPEAGLDDAARNEECEQHEPHEVGAGGLHDVVEMMANRCRPFQWTKVQWGSLKDRERVLQCSDEFP
jgi:hypothetical protein